jgi:hypothetical protein
VINVFASSEVLGRPKFSTLWGVWFNVGCITRLCGCIATQPFGMMVCFLATELCLMFWLKSLVFKIGLGLSTATCGSYV